jgi:hypothetical protein
MLPFFNLSISGPSDDGHRCSNSVMLSLDSNLERPSGMLLIFSITSHFCHLGGKKNKDKIEIPVFMLSSRSLHVAFTQSSDGLHVVFTCSSHGLHVVFMWYSRGLHVVFMRSSRGLHMAFTWPSHGLHAFFCWFSEGLTVSSRGLI